MPEPDFDKRGGLLPAIAQDVRTGQVLMVAYMNREAWRHTLATGKATYWSTSRNALWVKGETSGHVQHVRELLVDCDGDAVLLRVEQVGGVACHERSEEHTSELQSHHDLVCRLLLEKKNDKRTPHNVD